ncbi:hypothetical protein KIS4809_2148 [Bacillus sp. ZZV12-4809]|nr:hypothetical protein KIS4809_2148 [Bacillus sp. ZZV12-4809]
MYLLVSIFFTTILGCFLFMMGPLFAKITIFGIVVGTLFRMLYLINYISRRLPRLPNEVKNNSQINPKQ